MTLTRTQIEALVMRVQNDFLATPALKLPLREASQRFGLDIGRCKEILDALVVARVLTGPDGSRSSPDQRPRAMRARATYR